MKEETKHEIFSVAEVAQAHDGSLGIAHSYIDALSGTGINAVKFQVHIADAESSSHEPFRVKFSYVDSTRFDYWKRMEFSLQQWKGLKDHCDNVGLEFIASPFSNAAVDLLENLGVTRYKIGSGEVSNLLLLKKVALTGKEIILSSGLSSVSEVKSAVTYLRSFGNKISVLQCTTAYPTEPHQWGLNIIQRLKEEFDLPVGFSDHSGTIYACLAAAALGASILEFHVVFDRKMFGPDAKASLTIDEVKQLMTGVEQIKTALNNPLVKENKGINELKGMFSKSLSINKEMKAGQVISFDDLESKKPEGFGISAGRFENVIGKKLKETLKANSFLTEQNLL